MKYIYTGDGFTFIAGVPARDLTEDEFMALPKEAQEECTQTGLYLRPADFTERKAPTKGRIDLSDGVSDEEAKLAGQALAARRK